jgi:hypothetical protein
MTARIASTNGWDSNMSCTDASAKTVVSFIAWRAPPRPPGTANTAKKQRFFRLFAVVPEGSRPL